LLIGLIFIAVKVFVPEIILLPKKSAVASVELVFTLSFESVPLAAAVKRP